MTGLAAGAAPLAMAAGAMLGGFTLVSVSDEIAIGRQAHAEVRRQMPELTDAAVRGYVADLGRALVRVTHGPAYPYSFSVADDRDLNAFALPGGPVWIHRGILHAATSERQVVGVLAHEIAHIARRHAARQLTQAMVADGLLGLLGALLGNDGGARAARIGASLLAGGIFLEFSRDDEIEADRVGAEIMHRAGWDPRGLAEFMRILRRAQGRDPSAVETFFSTHPSPEGASSASSARRRASVQAAATPDASTASNGACASCRRRVRPLRTRPVRPARGLAGWRRQTPGHRPACAT
jgi:predicted Zn-dependent protease